MEAIRRLLLDDTEISLLLCWGTSPPFMHTLLSDNIHQSNSLDAFRPALSGVSSKSPPNVQAPSFPESPPSAALPHFQSPSLPFIDDIVPSPSSSMLYSLDLSLSQSITADLQEYSSSVHTLIPGLKGAWSPNPDLQLRISADPDLISQRSQVGTSQSFTLPSPFFDFSNLLALSPRVTQPNEMITTHVVPSPEKHLVSEVHAQSDLLQEVLTPMSSPLSSPPRSPLANLSDNNQTDSEVQHEDRTASYSSVPSGSHQPPATPMHDELDDPQLRYMPDTTHLKFTPDDTVDLETAALVIEKQSVIRRSRQLRSASNSLPATTTAVSRRIRTQGRAASVNLPIPQVALSLPLLKPLNAIDSDDVNTVPFNRARNTKMRMKREATTADLIHWKIDEPRPKSARGPRNRTSQQNFKSELEKENQAKIDVELPAATAKCD